MPTYHLFYECDAAPNGGPRLTLCDDDSGDIVLTLCDGNGTPSECARVVQLILACDTATILHPQSDELPNI